MPRVLINSGSPFEALAGYSRAVADGGFVFVSGTTGYDIEREIFGADAEAQTDIALAVVEKALVAAASSLDDIVRIRVYLSHRDHVAPVSAVLARVFAKTRPANTTIICGFAPPEMMVELEVTAMRREHP